MKHRLVTLKNVPEDTASMPGFHLLDMANEGTWLVDQDHPGFKRCVEKAIELAQVAGDNKKVEQYKKITTALGSKKKLTSRLNDVEKPTEK